MNTLHRLRCLAVVLALSATSADAAELPVLPVPDWQPFAAQVRRVSEALTLAGSPLNAKERAELEAALTDKNPDKARTRTQKILDAHVLVAVQVTPEMRVKAAPGPAPAVLHETGWVTFLVKVHNEAGTTAALRVRSPQAARLHGSPAETVPDRWLDVSLVQAAPLKPELGGLPVEYRLVQIYSRDAGRREAKLIFDVGQGSQDLGFRSEVDALFSKRLAPDFFFHPQVYRNDGESIGLPAGQYSVEFSRGPESLIQRHALEVAAGKTNRWRFQVQRWIDPSTRGWISGDHHIHAAGCAHYEKPTEGVLAADMMRHVLGEDLKIGANLTWGPCFDYQKQFFTGSDDPVSRWPYLLRYDVEVSGFGSHNSGHLCLLRLRQQLYPGGDSKKHWPTLGLNTLKWAKAQGALTGPAHSGWGLELDSTELPTQKIPPFSGIGANEYIVDVTHNVPGPDGKLVPAVDFISTVDTPYPWELNIWYHTLNAGYRTRISGETDFPCIYGERVGLGRSYVKLPERWSYEDWCEGIRAGRNYVGDGRSHLMDFRADTVVMGEQGSSLQLAKGRPVVFRVQAAARLNEQPQVDIQRRKFSEQPYWHIERARIGASRKVPVELIENGIAVARMEIEADGALKPIEISHLVTRSGWYALRILPSSHTNPIFIEVDGQPIRERRSIQWCLDSVEQCWKQKERFFTGAEHREAVVAFDHARQEYRSRLEAAQP
ncbi:MAG: CehA/McbA family metallohydrolase [Verrucomicrobia bacterium]|nr:CehA/McbA family metallohydrolase [Verrucomicrobiota bacterium]